MNKQKSLYPDILFHFTNKKALLGILKDHFKISYAREIIVGPENVRELGVPMVSFCDLKLSELKKFIEDDYGRYGIGLTKEWANRKGLNPVMYISRHCSITDNFIDGIDGMHTVLNKLDTIEDLKDVNEHYKNLLNIYRYIKNYEGDLKRRNREVISDYRFADDREWRYVPDIRTSGIEPFVNIERLKTQEQKKELNASLENLSLDFKIEDIKYLIVDNENDINELLDNMSHLQNDFNKKEMLRVTSKVLTVEQIYNDI